MLFTGRLTADAEVKELRNDKQVTNFTVALNHKFKTRAGEKKEKTAFIECAYWVNPGLAVYLTKGAIVEISGWVEAEAYVSKKDQTAKPRLVCSVDKIKLFSSTASSATETGTPPGKTQETQSKSKALPMYHATDAVDTTAMDGDDDLPF